MITREFLMNELSKRGISCEAKETVKNGVVLQSIILGKGETRPAIHMSMFEGATEADIESVIAYIKKIIQTTAPKINTEGLLNWNYVKPRLQLCLQKMGSEEICKRNFLDLEMYVRVMIDVEIAEGASMKITPDLLKHYGVTEDELFEAAANCTKPTTELVDITVLLAEMMQRMRMSPREVEAILGMSGLMTVISNKYRLNGASAICFLDTLKNVADMYETDLAILPSSVHECILVPVEETTNFRYMDAMIQEINATQVAPEDVLGNHAYRYIRDENRIVY